MGYKDVRARLEKMTPGEEFSFICIDRMAQKMDRLIPLNGGEIAARNVRSYGVIFAVRKL